MHLGFRETVFISLLLGMVVGTYALVVRPHGAERERRLSEIRSMDCAISGVGNSTQGLEELEQHIARQHEATALFRSRLPKEADIDREISEVIQTAAANSLQSRQTRVLDRQESNGIGARRVDLELTGNFNGFYSFLLQSEQMPRLMRIVQLNVAGGNEKEGQIQADLTLMMYFDSDAAK
jgi:Tfp pilus assembly protein PilO